MKKELNNQYYDNVYLSAKKYANNYKQSPYFRMWEGILSHIAFTERIADFGCGTGQFAQMATENGHVIAYGVDFSQVAIDMAEQSALCPFYCDSLYNEVYDLHDYEVAVMLEVLEHVDRDQEIVSMIPEGKRVILSVPNWDTESHVRHFETAQDVRERYEEHVNIDKINTFKVGKQGKLIFIIYGRRRS